jgi:glycosyltransferase involved in cell wall biosynthesis
MSLKISIIIPVYNGSNYLDSAINSALSQDYNEKEIIVINDGSNDEDKTKNIALSYGDKIIYLEKENGGVASALNFGISKMKGDFFSWLSHDDLYTPDKISKQFDYIVNNDLNFESTILFSNYHLIDFESKIFYTSSLDIGRPSQFRSWLTAYSYLNGCTLLIPKILFDKVGFFNERLKHTQDYDLWFRMSFHSDFIFYNDTLVYSRQHPEQDSRAKGVEALKEVSDLKKSFLLQLSKKEVNSYFLIFLKEFYTNKQLKLFLPFLKKLVKVQFQ